MVVNLELPAFFARNLEKNFTESALNLLATCINFANFCEIHSKFRTLPTLELKICSVDFWKSSTSISNVLIVPFAYWTIHIHIYICTSARVRSIHAFTHRTHCGFVCLSTNESNHESSLDLGLIILWFHVWACIDPRGVTYVHANPTLNTHTIRS